MKSIIFLFMASFASLTLLDAQSWNELNQKSLVAYQNGDYKTALTFGKKALRQAETEFGKQHINYITNLNHLSILHMRSGSYDKAILYSKENLQIISSLYTRESLYYSYALNNLASIYENMGLYEDVEPLLLQSLKIRAKLLGKAHTDYATCLNNLATFYTKKGLYKKAESFYLESLKIKANTLGKDHIEYAINLMNLAEFYKNMEFYEKAKPLYKESLNIFERKLGWKHPEFATILNNLASFHTSIGSYKKAESLYQESLEIISLTLSKEHPNYALCLGNLALFYTEIGLFEKGESLLTKSLQIIAKSLGKKHIEYANGLDYLAKVYYCMSLYEKANFLYQESLKIKVNLLGKKHPAYATGLNDLGLLYLKMGDYEKVEPLLQKSRQISANTLGKNHSSYATILHNLAMYYENIGSYKEAELFYQESLQITGNTRGEDHHLYAVTLHNLGNFYMRIGYHKKAEDSLLKSLQITISALGEEHLSYSTILRDLALLYHKTGFFYKSEKLNLQCINIMAKIIGKDHLDYAISLHNLALLYESMELYNKAKLLYHESLEITVNIVGMENLSYARSLISLASIYEKLDSTETAIQYYIEGINSYDTQLKRYYPSLSEREKIQFLRNDIEILFQSFYSFIFRCIDSFSDLSVVMMNLDLKNKSLILSSTSHVRNTILESGDSILSKRYIQWLSHRYQIANATTLSNLERNNRGINLDDLKIKVDSLEKYLSRNAQSFAEQFEDSYCRWNDIQSYLGKDEVSISFMDFRYFDGKIWTDTTHYLALVIRPEDEYPRLVKLCMERDLEKKLNYKKANEQGTYITDTEIAAELYQLIWEPLLPYLEGRSVVHYSPSGLLNRVAFQLLMPSNSRHLNDAYQLNQYTTLRDFIKQKKQKTKNASNTITTFGGADFNRRPDTEIIQSEINQLTHQNYEPTLSQNRGEVIKHWSSIEGTKKEVESINQLSNLLKWDTKSYTGISATEQNLKKLSGNSPRILHIATHGFFLPDPKVDTDELNRLQLLGNSYQKNISLSEQPLMRSGLIFTGANHAWKGGEVPEGVDDGILTSYEIINLDLRNTELVVLSACDTGLGDIQSTEGVFGLQRAFKQAGVDKVIMSLWNIPDNETVEFMEAFYGYYLNGDTIRDAFIKTQREMSEKHEPYYWAGFVLME